MTAKERAQKRQNVQVHVAQLAQPTLVRAAKPRCISRDTVMLPTRKERNVVCVTISEYGPYANEPEHMFQSGWPYWCSSFMRNGSELKKMSCQNGRLDHLRASHAVHCCYSKVSGRTKQFWVTLTPRIASNSVIAADSSSLMDSGDNHSSYGINCAKHWRSCCTFLTNGSSPSAQSVSWSGRPNCSGIVYSIPSKQLRNRMLLRLASREKVQSREMSA